VFPAARASGNIQSGIIAGKLNGQIPATTPSGTRQVCESTPRAMPSTVRPCASVGMPQAKSTTSMPRRTSPRASATSLPFSRDTDAASASCSRSRSAL
jgi:hypothetical protein